MWDWVTLITRYVKGRGRLEWDAVYAWDEETEDRRGRKEVQGEYEYSLYLWM